MPTRPWGSQIPKPHRPLAVLVHDYVHERLMRCARNEKLSPSSIVETAVDEWLTKNGYAPLPRKMKNVDPS